MPLLIDEELRLPTRSLNSYEAIRKQSRKVMDFYWKLDILEAIARDGASDGDRIRAIAEANKMQGHYSAVSTIEVGSTYDAEINHGVRELSDIEKRLKVEHKREY